MMMKYDENICCLCGDPITELERNNPDPVVTDPGAWCCPKCNAKYVIPARLKEYRKLNREEQNGQEETMNNNIISFSDKAEEKETEQAFSDIVVSAAILALIDTTQEVNAILHALNDSMPGKSAFPAIISSLEKAEEQEEGSLQDFYSLVTMQGYNLVSLGKAIKRKHPELLAGATENSWIMKAANKSLNGMTHIKKYLTLWCKLSDLESETEEA